MYTKNNNTYFMLILEKHFYIRGIGMTEVEIVKKFENHEMRLQKAEETLNALQTVYKEIKDLTVSVHDLSNSVLHMAEKQEEVNQRVAQIENEPVKRWNELIKTIIACVVTAVVAFVLTKVGLK